MGKFSGYLICTDYDGTVAIKGELVEENLAAIRYFTEEGGYFTVASGRMPQFLEERNVHKLINAPAAFCNGSLIYDYSSKTYLRKRFLGFYLPTFLEAVAPLRDSMTGMNVFWEDDGALYQNMEELAQIHKQTPLLKLLCRFETETAADAFRDFLLAQPIAQLCYISKSWSLGVEINPLDGTKGHALDFIKAYLQDVHTAVGVGNYDNDRPLLAHAQIGAAPEGSLDSVLAMADLKLCPCPEGAIRDLIEKLDKA